LSHVPPQRFEAFWDTVRLALNRKGNAFFIDSLFEQTLNRSGPRTAGPVGYSPSQAQRRS
jgi:hypothetical protein